MKNQINLLMLASKGCSHCMVSVFQKEENIGAGVCQSPVFSRLLFGNQLLLKSHQILYNILVAALHHPQSHDFYS